MLTERLKDMLLNKSNFMIEYYEKNKHLRAFERYKEFDLNSFYRFMTKIITDKYELFKYNNSQYYLDRHKMTVDMVYEWNKFREMAKKNLLYVSNPHAHGALHETRRFPVSVKMNKKENIQDANKLDEKTSNNKCFIYYCSKTAHYNYNSSKRPIYCSIHKQESMINVRTKKCLSEWCSSYQSNKNTYKGYCHWCYIHLFPNENVSRNYKTKEKAVTEFILQKFHNYDWILDKKVTNGCSKRRPDLMVDFGFQVLIIEVDENQHKNYDSVCENKRIMEISRDLGHRKIILIRFNPDNYIDEKRKNISGCWSAFKTGRLVIKKNKINDWENRLNALKEAIEYWTENETNKMLHVVYLFFDKP
jgi:hypothetical protein